MPLSAMADTLQTLKTALNTFLEVCHGPLPRDYYVAQHWGMAGAHAFLVNGLISIYEQATDIPAEKTDDFVGYALQWTAAMHHHHYTEETAFFPMLSPKFDSSFVKDEHETFIPQIEALQEYLVSCLPSDAPYGHDSFAGTHEQQEYVGTRVLALIDAFVEDLCKHLVHEVELMEPGKLRATGLTEVEMKAIADEMLRYSKSMPLRMTTLLTYATLLSPKETEFPPFPAFVRKYLVPHVLAFPHRRLWQFAPK
ncbi:hypothetical protein BXZ70DRAFT_1010923 [Cristinia sonorae]|uniref:Hemerythrin-like domain-containing protein n=1 Tax=Cristinia sonorae TaxID=1940300 RepID=A0A8K0UIL9_9AGAR|nr:hypothetical protein BXZ70DRAFT_1010923 [Cristinia sonorae]